MEKSYFIYEPTIEMPGGNKVSKCRIDASPPGGMMKHLEEAFAGSWHMYGRWWGENAGLGTLSFNGHT